MGQTLAQRAQDAADDRKVAIHTETFLKERPAWVAEVIEMSGASRLKEDEDEDAPESPQKEASPEKTDKAPSDDASTAASTPQKSQEEERIKQAFEACREMDEIRTLQLCRQQVVLEAEDEFGNTPLHVAAEVGFDPVIIPMLRMHSDPEAKNCMEWTPVMMAAFHGQIGVIQDLVATSIDINQQDKHGCNVLHIVAVSPKVQQIACVTTKERRARRVFRRREWLSYKEKMIQKMKDKQAQLARDAECARMGIPPSPVRSMTSTSIGAGFGGGSEAAQAAKRLWQDASNQFEVLIMARLFGDPYARRSGEMRGHKTGLLVDVRDHNRQTPLHYAATYGLKMMCSRLLYERANIEAADKDGKTALHLAVEGQHLEVVELLLTCGAEQYGDGLFWTPLHQALYMKHEHLAKMLLNAQADVNAVSADGKTCLMVCMEANDNYMFCEMMAYDPDLDSVDSKGWNVLIWAIRQGMLKLFIHEMGTKLTGESLFLACHYQDPQGFTPLHHAILMQRLGDVKLMCDIDLQHRQKSDEALVLVPDANGTTPLHLGAQQGGLDILDTLCGVVADLDPLNAWGETPLLIAARCGNLAVITHLLDTHHHFVAASGDVVDKAGKGMLHHAVMSGHLDLVNLLLVNKEGDNRRFAFPPFDINHVDKEGFTAVMTAAREMQWQVIPSLVMAKANVHNGDRDGWTALMLAAYGGCTQTVCALIDSTASLDMQDHAGWTALMHAVSVGNQECAEAIIDARADLRVRNFTLQTALMVAKGTPDIIPSRRAGCEEAILDALREEEVRGKLCPVRGPGSVGLKKPSHVQGYLILTIIGAEDLWLEGHQPHELNTYAYAECAPNSEHRASCLTACCLQTNKPVYYETVRFDVPVLEADGVVVIVLFACTGRPEKLIAEMDDELKMTKVLDTKKPAEVHDSMLEKKFKQLQKAREKLLAKEAKAAKEITLEPTASAEMTLQARRWANLELHWRLAGFGDYLPLPPMPKKHYPLGFVTIRAASIQYVVKTDEPIRMSRQLRGSQSGRLHLELDFRADNMGRCFHENPGWPGGPNALSATPREGLLSGSDGGSAFPMPPLEDPSFQPTRPWGQPRPLVIKTDTGEG